MPASFKKIVFYGPALAGKRTCVQWLHAQVSADKRGKLMLSPPSLPGAEGNLLWFDSMSRWGAVRVGCVPGMVFKDAARIELLLGASGIVFVVDSRLERLEASLESVEGMFRLLRAQGREAFGLPMALLYNKRDLPGAVPHADLRQALGFGGDVPVPPEFDGIAIRGLGVAEAFGSVAERVFAAA